MESNRGNRAPRSGEEEDRKPEYWWQPAVLLFARLSAWIAGPVLVGSFFGRWLDRKFGTEPWLFLGTVGLAFLVSMFGLVKNAAEEFRKIESDAKVKKDPGRQNETGKK